ncbi:hypothetical protein LOTGIDRAFT_197896 [Lottia gigantea]|uniref:BTB domain-containing protein n=1 Tax=Lottia gigantea TaxID=225164 RepID=V4B2I2_LOTGI|nr:hypothetical protein LOTGIDRAFT_197896 [Lottia gigantea]ESO82599.1 hypothetical protein LOTGIDRAFT_197896 [Lottia gigantea]
MEVAASPYLDSNSGLKEFRDQLNEIREQELFCDVKIRLNNGENCTLSVHRAILASCSPFFRSLFTSAMADSKKVEILLPEISKEEIETIIQFAYTNQVDLSPDTIESIFIAADRLHVLGLLKLCANYLEENVDPLNAVGVYRLAHHCHCRFLEVRVENYIVTHFDQVWKESAEFLQLHINELLPILQHNRLNVPTENMVVQASMRWVHHYPKRKRHYYDLLATARLGRCDKFFIEDVILKNKTIMAQKACRDLVYKAYAMSQFTLLQKTQNYLNAPCYMLMPRNPHGVIFILGGWTNDSVCGHMESYDNRVGRWYSLKTTVEEKPLAYHALVTHGRFVYVIGGFTTATCLNTVKRWDPLEEQWEVIANMHDKRCYVGAAAIDNYVYACGGFDGETRHSSAEKYCPQKNQWCYIAPMRSIRSDSGVCALDGLLYVCGGFDGGACLISTEVYSPKTNQWTMIEDMGIHRSGVAVASFEGYIYVLGGFNGLQRLGSVERYHPATKKWSTVNGMSHSRSNFAITTLERKIYAIGGFNGTSTSNTVECYDIDKDEWTTVKNLVVGRSATSACTVYGLLNVMDYTFFTKDLPYQQRSNAISTRV